MASESHDPGGFELMRAVINIAGVGIVAGMIIVVVATILTG